MKKLLIRVLVVLVLFFVMDRALGLALKYLYRQSNATDEYKISYANELTRDSVLFMGSSRCLHHYAPAVFEKEWGLSCFNAADWGIKNIYFHFGLLGNILERYTPRTIIFEIHPCDWLETPFSGIERAGSLAPYCGQSEACDEMLKLTGKYWPYRLSMVYRYSGSLPNLLAGGMGTMDRNLKGWKPMDGLLKGPVTTPEEYPFPLSQERMALLERFVKTCQQKQIQLIWIFSPMYICSEEDVLKVPRELASKYGIPFFDYYRNPDFMGHEELFFDFGHLNRKGAELYSEKVSRDLKDLVLNHR